MDIRIMVEAPIKTVVWIGPTLKELKSFPRPVQRAVGRAFYAPQLGETPPDAKPVKGFSGAESAGAGGEPKRGRLPRGLHRPVRDEDLRAARLPEEIEARHRDAAEGNR